MCLCPEAKLLSPTHTMLLYAKVAQPKAPKKRSRAGVCSLEAPHGGVPWKLLFANLRARLPYRMHSLVSWNIALLVSV